MFKEKLNSITSFLFCCLLSELSSEPAGAAPSPPFFLAARAKRRGDWRESFRCGEPGSPGRRLHFPWSSAGGSRPLLRLGQRLRFLHPETSEWSVCSGLPNGVLTVCHLFVPESVFKIVDPATRVLARISFCRTVGRMCVTWGGGGGGGGSVATVRLSGRSWWARSLQGIVIVGTVSSVLVRVSTRRLS